MGRQRYWHQVRTILKCSFMPYVRGAALALAARVM